MQGERFYLRLLLTVVPGMYITIPVSIIVILMYIGATSYRHLQMVGGTLHSSFRHICVVLVLLEDDREWIHSFEEAILFTTGGVLCTLFATAIIHSGVVDAAEIWHRFKLHLCNDLPRRLQRMAIDLPDLAESPHLGYGLYLLALIFADTGKGLVDYGLPTPIARWDRIAHSNPLVARDLAYDVHAEQALALQYAAQLNADQRLTYDSILAHVASLPQKSHFFIKGLQVLAKHFYTNASVHTTVDKARLDCVLHHQVSPHYCCQAVV